MRNRPSIDKIQCLYGVWYPKHRRLLGLSWEGEERKDEELFTPQMFDTPGEADHAGIRVKTLGRHKDSIPAPPYVVVKFIPVAVVTTEYKQQRIADGVTS